MPDLPSEPLVPVAPTAGHAIREGYQPGCIGDVAALHARFYARAWGFGAFFERRVATELAEFAQALPASGKALWLYGDAERVRGSVAIDGDERTRVAHLRWFIVDEALHGSGVGRALLARAMEFVDARFDETWLSTFRGLDAARRLYESHGFVLTDEAEGNQWGSVVVEQRFSRRRGHGPGGPVPAPASRIRPGTPTDR